MRKHLVFDGDDTLWHNNRFFEEIIEEFIDVVAHPHLDRAAVRTLLDDIERVNCELHGYGAKGFAVSLGDCLQRLMADGLEPREIDHLLARAEGLLDRPVELIDGVEETLRELAGRHDLVLLTKGTLGEQEGKIARSGLADYFRARVVVPEKNTAVYEAIVEDHDLDRANTWMIGNSPKSDIVPALAAGLNAILIRNPDTWVLEHDEVPAEDERFVELPSFRALADRF